MAILSCNIRPVAKCQKQAHPDPPISSANASPDSPVVHLYDQKQVGAALVALCSADDRGIVPWDFSDSAALLRISADAGKRRQRSIRTCTRRNPVIDRQHGGRLRCARYAVLKI